MFQKKAKILACLAMLATSLVYAEDEKKLCPELCPTSPFIPKQGCCRNFHIDIGLLYQQPSVNGMVPAIAYENTRDETIDGVTYVDTDGNLLLPSFDYAVGLTASLGYFMKHDDWYLGANFDWLRRDLSKSYNYTSNSNAYILYAIPLFVSDNVDSSFGAIEALDGEDLFDRLNYKGDVNYYDLRVILSKGSYHTKYFSYEPMMGVQAIWFDSTLTSTLFEKDGLDNGSSKIYSSNWGVGPMVAVSGEFHVVRQFTFFAQSEVGALYGEADQKVTLFSETYDDEDLQTVNSDVIKANADLMIYIPIRNIIGIKLSTYLRDYRHYLALKLGYDVRAIMPFPVPSRGYYMSGLYTDLIWSF